MGVLGWFKNKFGGPGSAHKDSVESAPSQQKVDAPLADVDKTPYVEEKARRAVSMNRAKRVFVQLETGNTLYSPVSLEMSLGLLSECAVGDTREQLLEFLGVAGYNETAGMLMGTSDVEAIRNGHQTALNLANSLWLDNRYVLKESYRVVAESVYKAIAKTLDFSEAGKVADAVNAWCCEQTNGMIPSILSPSAIQEDMGVILCNALYFESAWTAPWDVSEGKFTNADGNTVTLKEMLYSVESVYYETKNAVAFSKPYTCDRTFLGILPNEGVSLRDIDLVDLLKSVSFSYTVNVSMPKLRYDSICRNLKFILRHLGVSGVFNSSGAGLDAMAEDASRLFVSDIIQKCRIELDEQGTKAAAVTCLDGFDGCCDFDTEEMEVKNVHLNRPFYFAILDDTTDQVLFFGHVDTVNGETSCAE